MILNYQEYICEAQNLRFQAGINAIEKRGIRRNLIDPLMMGLNGNYVIKSYADPIPIIGKPSYDLYPLLPGEKYICEFPPFNPGENRNPSSYSDAQFRSDYGLIYSDIPDLVISPNDSPASFITVEVKSLFVNNNFLEDPEYKAQGAQKLIQLYHEKKISKATIKAIYDSCSQKCTDLNIPCVSDMDYRSNIPGADTVTFDNGEIIRLYQEDWNILDLQYAQKANVRSVNLTNGRLVRRFYKEANQIKSRNYNLYIENDFSTWQEDLRSDLK
ncbi:MAG: hypothetical protein IKS61_01400 [Aeriscardovia sp.]|nr:hypothetical protein [Aeriscardovia sp.]